MVITFVISTKPLVFFFFLLTAACKSITCYKQKKGWNTFGILMIGTGDT